MSCSISRRRARFDDLTRMSRAELDLAIERLGLPEEDPLAMPARSTRPAVNA